MSRLSPTLYPSGHTSWARPRILACGGRLWVSARWSSEAEEVPDCSRFNWWVISNHQPPTVRKAPGSPPGNGRLRSLANPARPLCLGGIPHRPPPERALGNGMLPVVLKHLPPPVGACGNKTMAFFSIQTPRSELQPCFRSFSGSSKARLFAAQKVCTIVQLWAPRASKHQSRNCDRAPEAFVYGSSKARFSCCVGGRRVLVDSQQLCCKSATLQIAELFISFGLRAP